MRRVVTGFHQDDSGDWVADLECLHRMHVRHNPPFDERGWILDDDARAARVGTEFDCVLCDRFELPDDLHVARTAGPFDAPTLPAGLRRDHRVGRATWGRLRVVAGSAVIVFDEPHRLLTGETHPIPPEVPHRVELDDDAVIEVDFLVR